MTLKKLELKEIQHLPRPGNAYNEDKPLTDASCDDASDLILLLSKIQVKAAVTEAFGNQEYSIVGAVLSDLCLFKDQACVIH